MSLDDLRKQKLWTLGDDPLGTSLIDKLKLAQFRSGIAEVDGALTSGRINACFSSPLGAIVLQWYTKVKYMASTPMVFAIGATVMSLDAVEQASPRIRRIVETIAKRSQKKARVAIRKANEDARKALLRKGITVVDVPKAMVDEPTAIGAMVQSELVGKVFSKEELAMVIGYRDEYRSGRNK